MSDKMRKSRLNQICIGLSTLGVVQASVEHLAQIYREKNKQDKQRQWHQQRDYLYGIQTSSLVSFRNTGRIMFRWNLGLGLSNEVAK